MKLTWKDRTYDIRQIRLTQGKLAGVINGEPVSLPVSQRGESLIVGGDQPGMVDVAVMETTVHVQCCGNCWTLARPVEDDAGPGDVGGDGSVKAPMPGKVLACEVVEGDTVAPDQVLVRMESMKLQVEVRAPKAGRVRAVHAAAGDMVVGGAVLVELAAPDG